jgi:hypothetical protein
MKLMTGERLTNAILISLSNSQDIIKLITSTIAERSRQAEKLISW